MSRSGLRWRAACLAAASCAVLLSACGGGGSTLTQPTDSSGGAYPVGRVVSRLAKQGESLSASRVDNSGNQTTLKVEYAPGMPGWFTRRETLIANGVSGETRVKSFQFTDSGSQFQIVGWADDSGNTATNLHSIALPSSTSVGTGASLFTADLVIQNNGLNTVDVGLTHGLSYAWSLAAVSAASAVSPLHAELCLSLAERADFITYTRVDCFRVDTAGSIVGFKSTLKVHAKSIDSETVYQ